MEEIEVKYIDIDVPDLEKKLEVIGAEKVGEYLYRSKTFDYADLRLDKDMSWVRMRDEGDKVTLAYKKRLGVTSEGGNDTGMEEVEIEVSDYEKTAQIFLKIGLIEKFSQEKKRIRYKKGTTEFDIDFWPGIPPYLEIEAQSWEDIDAVAVELGLTPDKRMICSATQIYAHYGINDKEYETMTFSEGLVKRTVQLG
ncbi:MAG: CYTH domain-containing protein [Patescibacteria group bacterium]